MTEPAQHADCDARIEWFEENVLTAKDADSVAVPRSLLFKLYRTWLDHHGCYVEDCTCNQTIATVQALLRIDGEACGNGS